MSANSPDGRWKNIALIGYRGCGKSSVAPLLADRLGWPCRDADREIERRAGRSIAALFAEQGEPAMRDLESDVVRELAVRGGCVLSLGGGAVLREANRRALAETWTVWLTASPEELARRLAQDPRTGEQRPQLTPLGVLEEIAVLLERRRDAYAAAAWTTLDTEGHSPEEIATRIAEQLDWSRYEPPGDA